MRELNGYLRVHWTILNKFESENWIASHTINLVKAGDSVLYIAGQIALQGPLVLSVRKLLSYTPPDQAGRRCCETLSYSYNAFIPGHHTLLRYDTYHPDSLHPGHLDKFHVHRFDWVTGDELPDSPEWLGWQKWPRLGDVLQELREWHSDNHAALGSIAARTVSPSDLLSAEQVVLRT